ncbi:MAG TPA: AAA family ATPase [Actinoplanes sp.]|nr:AAA family ATPase [Actinoplanes sp.]
MTDDPDLRRFAAEFRAFMEAVRAQLPPAEPSGLARRLEEHLGVDPAGLPVITESLAPYELANIQAAMDAFVAGPAVTAELIGIAGSGREHQGFADILDSARRHGQYDIGAVDYATVSVGVGRERACVSYGLYLITEHGHRHAALVRLSGHRRGEPELLIEALGADPEATRAFLRAVRDLGIRHHVARGQVLSFESHEYGHGIGPLRFHERPAVGAGDVVLPAGVLESVHRQVMGVAEHRDRLLAAGHHLKRGVVLFGPPGTGKTLTVRHLIGAQTDTTVVVLTGFGLHFIREACNLARLLPPAVVVLEDVDLVAEDRDLSPLGAGNPLLFQLLNEMDGVAGDADIAFLLTTNRLDLVEPALAQRPGRVDLVAEVPLPDEAGRRRLLALYGVSAHLRDDEVERVVAATAGTTGSFFAELARRAELLAATAGDARAGLSHILAALDELGRSRAAVENAIRRDPSAPRGAMWPAPGRAPAAYG